MSILQHTLHYLKHLKTRQPGQWQCLTCHRQWRHNQLRSMRCPRCNGVVTTGPGTAGLRP